MDKRPKRCRCCGWVLCCCCVPAGHIDHANDPRCLPPDMAGERVAEIHPETRYEAIPEATFTTTTTTPGHPSEYESRDSHYGNGCDDA